MVSERGEQWSPKMPPDTTAPMVSRMLPFIATAMGTAMGIMMENVPQLVPVQKAINAPIRKMMAGQKAPSMLSPSRLARNWPVPIPLMTPPMEKDSTRRITRPIMLLTPFITLSPNSLAVMIPCFVYMTHMMSSVMTTE